MTEKEELEKGVLESKMRQQMTELSNYLNTLNEDCFRLYIWTHRADAGFFLTLSAQLLIGLLGYKLGVSAPFMEMVHSLTQLLTIIMIGRSWMHYRAWGEKRSEREGAFKVLEILGYVKPMGDPETRNKQPLWEKGIRAVEAWTAKRKEQFGKGFGVVPA